MQHQLLRDLPSSALVIIACILFSAAGVLAQNDSCVYEKASIEKAEDYIRATNYPCAERILKEFLQSDTLSSFSRSRCHGWLAYVYISMHQEAVDKCKAGLEQYLMALNENPSFKPEVSGDPIVDSTFRAATDSLRARAYYEDERRIRACQLFLRDAKRNRVYRMVAAGAGAAAIVGALVVNRQAGDAHDEYRASVAPADISSAWDDYTTKVQLRNILIGAAGALFVTEVYFLATKPHEPDFGCDGYREKAKAPKIGLTTDGRGLTATLWFGGI